VRMRQFQGAFRLMFKLIQQRSILNHQIRKKFQRDIALQFFVTGQPHDPHSASSEHLDQRVAVKNDLTTGCIQRRLEKAAWAASLRRVAWDLGSAASANSDSPVQGCLLWGRTIGTQIHFAAGSRASAILTRYSLSTWKKD